MTDDVREEYFREDTIDGMTLASNQKDTASDLHQKAEESGYPLAQAAAWEAIEWANRAQGHYRHANALGGRNREAHKIELNGSGALKRCEEALAKAHDLMERGE